MENIIIYDINQITWATATLIAFLTLYKSGMLNAFAKKLMSGINGQSENHEGRIGILEVFKAEAEENHWHDIDNLQKEMKEIKDDFKSFKSEVRLTLNEHGKDLAVLKSKL